MVLVGDELAKALLSGQGFEKSNFVVVPIHKI